jgi:hypothetical protein
MTDVMPPGLLRSLIMAANATPFSLLVRRPVARSASERPSMLGPFGGSKPARSRIVGVRSVRLTVSRMRPGTMPGPAITSGTRICEL